MTNLLLNRHHDTHTDAQTAATTNTSASPQSLAPSLRVVDPFHHH
jgi:hypothetical protein